MLGYETGTPRVALGAAAVAMTTITLGLSVAVPVRVETASPASRVVDASHAVRPQVPRPPAMGVSVDIAGAAPDAAAQEACRAQCPRASATDAPQHGASARRVRGIPEQTS